MIIVFLFIGYTKFYIEPLEKEASEKRKAAEFYFQNNDFDKAVGVAVRVEKFLTAEQMQEI